MNKDQLWLTWERQVRNRSLADRLGAHLEEICVEGGRPKRYLVSTLRTLQLLFRWRERIVFVQSPSLVLALQALLLRPFLRYRLIIDAHNAGVYPGDREEGFLTAVARWTLSRANLVIVTNSGLAAYIERIGGRAFVLPDPIPKFESSRKALEVSNSHVLFICTWAVDEPYQEVFSAAELLPTVQFLVTGNSKGREKRFGRAMPANVTLTGFLPRSEYESLLRSSVMAIDLTTRENCLVCGAYEAVAAGVPFVISDTQALRAHFRKGGKWVANSATAIADAIKQIRGNNSQFREEVADLKQVLESEWIQQETSLRTALRTL